MSGGQPVIRAPQWGWAEVTQEAGVVLGTLGVPGASEDPNLPWASAYLESLYT